MKTYAATNNAGKLAEMRAIFADSPLELSVYPEYASVPEVAADYLGNALLKAKALARQLADAGIRAAALADDSGMEVAALGGRPGVYSARYGGADATWESRRLSLLDELRGVPAERRGARFVSAMALISAAGEIFTAQGTVDGSIVERAAGSGGFGYDPLFFYAPRGRTFAQLQPEEKNAVSHRRAAAQELLAALARHG